MANRFPLIVNSSALQIQELAANDNIDLTNSGIVNAASIGSTTLNVTGIATFGGNVSIAGTLTYEDVTNVDSVGLVTARTGVKVTAGGVDITAGGLNVTSGVATFAQSNPVSLTVSGVATFSNDIRVRGVVERVAAATTYVHSGQTVLELDMQAASTYTYTMLAANIGIVSFKNLPADTQNGSTVTVLFTQNGTTPVGNGNTTATLGIGTNCTVVPLVSGSPIAGISTRALVGSATTITLSSTASDVDFVSFFVHYTGGTSSAAASYKVYATKNGGFQRGNVGV